MRPSTTPSTLKHLGRFRAQVLDTGRGLVASQFVLHGMHTGPYFHGSPPTGRTVAYPIALFTQIEGDKVRSEHVYFDRQTAAELPGLKAK